MHKGLLLYFFCLSLCAAADLPPFVTADGRHINFDAIRGKRASILLLVKPWDGLSREILEDWANFFTNNHNGAVRATVVFLHERRSAVNRYIAEHKWRFSWVLDENRVLRGRLSPPVLPYLYILDKSGKAFFGTCAPRAELLRSLSRRPGQAIRRISRSLRQGPKPPPRISHGPWGPPKPQENAFQ